MSAPLTWKEKMAIRKAAAQAAAEEASAAPAKKGTRFLGNDTGSSSVAPNIGVRYGPNDTKLPGKSALKRRNGNTRTNASPPAVPGNVNNLNTLPPKFRKMVENKIAEEAMTQSENVSKVLSESGGRRRTRRRKSNKRYQRLSQ
jgi:hypothetical protein